MLEGFRLQTWLSYRSLQDKMMVSFVNEGTKMHNPPRYNTYTVTEAHEGRRHEEACNSHMHVVPSESTYFLLQMYTCGLVTLRCVNVYTDQQAPGIRKSVYAFYLHCLTSRDFQLIKRPLVFLPLLALAAAFLTVTLRWIARLIREFLSAAWYEAGDKHAQIKSWHGLLGR